ncbi:MAG: hypothetical protein LBV18_07320 [Alistipes sp.]|jgi:hypothetical protein|nr:hypothetical protein [Alistipes sp.]
MKKVLHFAAMIFAVAAVSGCVADYSAPEAPDLETRGGKSSDSSITTADRKAAVEVRETRSDRKNASGPKITSNCQSDEFPGMLFIWDSKHKDNGYLKVESWVFEKFENFTLTSKESNNYWDFKIEIKPGQKPTKEGYYVYFIPKVCGNKKINMVFVGDFCKKQPVETEPALVEYTATVLSGVDFGVPVTDVTESGISFQEHWNSGITRTDYSFDAIAEAAGKNNPSWAWNDEHPLDGGFTGETVEFSATFNVEGETITGSEVLFAADNAVAVWINDVLVGFTPATGLNDKGDIFVLNGSMNQGGFGWGDVYVADATTLGTAIVTGENTLRVLARNAANAKAYPDLDLENIDEGRLLYSDTNNAGGVLFALAVDSETVTEGAVQPEKPGCDKPGRPDCDNDRNDCDRDRDCDRRDCDRCDRDRNGCDRDRDCDRRDCDRHHDRDRHDNDRDKDCGRDDRHNCNGHDRYGCNDSRNNCDRYDRDDNNGRYNDRNDGRGDNDDKKDNGKNDNDRDDNRNDRNDNDRNDGRGDNDRNDNDRNDNGKNNGRNDKNDKNDRNRR